MGRAQEEVHRSHWERPTFHLRGSPDRPPQPPQGPFEVQPSAKLYTIPMTPSASMVALGDQQTQKTEQDSTDSTASWPEFAISLGEKVNRIERQFKIAETKVTTRIEKLEGESKNKHETHAGQARDKGEEPPRGKTGTNSREEVNQIKEYLASSCHGSHGRRFQRRLKLRQPNREQSEGHRACIGPMESSHPGADKLEKRMTAKTEITHPVTDIDHRE